MTKTQTLLAEYVAHGSESAFRELMQSHLSFVYSTAHRLAAGDAQLAQDITQTVFLDLAHQAKALPADTKLGGWLHRHTCFVAAKHLRTERRRQTRERQAMEMQELSSDSAPDYRIIAPVLDEAVNGLEEPDRTLILLRFFEQQSFGLISENLGVKEDAARMRLNRALEKLALILKSRGIKSTAAALAAVLTTQAVQSAPAGLAATISVAIFADSAVPATIIATTKTLTMTLLQKIAVTAALTVTVGAGIYAAKQAANARAEVQTLRNQQVPLAEQIQQLKREGDQTTNRLADLLAENSRLKSSPNQKELLKLRGEVGRLRQQLQALPSARADLLKQKLAQMPDKRTPEMKFLTEKDWINAAWNADLDTDDGVRLALSKLRDEATDTFLSLTRTALKKYLAANGDILPANLLALQSYYDTPVTDEMLERYAFMQSGKLSSNPSDSVVRKAVYADPDYDSNQEMSMSGGGGGSFNLVHNAIYDAVVAYTVANNGQAPSDPSQVTAYLKRQVDAAAVQKYFDPIVADLASNAPPPAVAEWLVPALKAFSADHAGQFPKTPSDLQPYLTTPEQQAELQKMVQNGPVLNK